MKKNVKKPVLVSVKSSEKKPNTTSCTACQCGGPGTQRI